MKSIVLIFSILSIFAVRGQKTHTITLTCDTTEITKENVNKVCSFGQDENISNEDFTLDAAIGDIIVWRGQAKNSNLSSSIVLSQVNYQGGKNVFGRNTLNDSGGLIIGQVIQGEPGNELKYNLKFRVFVDGRRISGTFTIDPRIRIII